MGPSIQEKQAALYLPITHFINNESREETKRLYTIVHTRRTPSPSVMDLFYGHEEAAVPSRPPLCINLHVDTAYVDPISINELSLDGWFGTLEASSNLIESFKTLELRACKYDMDEWDFFSAIGYLNQLLRFKSLEILS